MRDADPSTRVYRLKHIMLYDPPVVPDLESQQSLIARHERTGLPGPLLVPLSRQKFEMLTARGRSEDQRDWTSATGSRLKGAKRMLTGGGSG